MRIVFALEMLRTRSKNHGPCRLPVHGGPHGSAPVQLTGIRQSGGYGSPAVAEEHEEATAVLVLLLVETWRRRT
jgi:hypothetical protein